METFFGINGIFQTPPSGLDPNKNQGRGSQRSLARSGEPGGGAGRRRLAVQTMRNVRAKRREEYLTSRTAKGARRGLRRSYCAWSRYGDILRHQRHLSNSTFGARPE